MSREEFCRLFNIPENKKIILFISGAAYSEDEPDILREISKWISGGRFSFPAHILLRPYMNMRDMKKETEKYKALANDPNISYNLLKASDGRRDAYFGMYYYADAVISIFSTTAIEAALFDKPVLTIGFDGHTQRPYHQSVRRLEELSHFKHVLDTGSVKVVRNFGDLFQSLDDYLKNPKLDGDKRRLLIEKMCHKADGRSSERVANFILSKISNGLG